jgi:hypothetical protein
MKNIFLSFCCVCAFCAGLLLPLLCYSQQVPATDPAMVTVTGKVLVQQHGKEPWVIVHGKDATAYLVTGAFIDQLKAIAQEKNSARTIVTLQGIQNGQSSISCERLSKYETDARGAKKMVIKARCIKYYALEVTAITGITQSDETIPEPRRDPAAEEKALASIAQSNRSQGIMGEIYGKIKTCNLQSVPKTIEIQNVDKGSSIKTLSVIMTADTRIVKHIGKEEPSPLLPENLKPGQRVTVVYTRNEIRTEARYITVTKE